MTAARPVREPDIPVLEACCPPGGSCAELGMPAVRDAGWRRAARLARSLAWASLAWMCIEGAVGLWQGLGAGSIALIGWALGSAVEGLASVIVIWRFTGTRVLSGTAERLAVQSDQGDGGLARRGRPLVPLVPLGRRDGPPVIGTARRS